MDVEVNEKKEKKREREEEEKKRRMPVACVFLDACCTSRSPFSPFSPLSFCDSLCLTLENARVGSLTRS